MFLSDSNLCAPECHHEQTVTVPMLNQTADLTPLSEIVNTPALTTSEDGSHGVTSPTLTETQLREANKRRLVLLAAKPLLESGASVNKTAMACAVKHVFLHRLLAMAPEQAGERLTSAERCRRLLDAPTATLAPAVPGGQTSPFEVLLEMPTVVAEINRLYSATMGASCAQATIDRRTGSISTTLLRLADFNQVPPALAAKLRARTKPGCLVDFIKATWTPEIEAKFRGQKHYQLATSVGRRELTEELMDGTRVPLKPGRVWVFDDMSSNIPFWFDVDEMWALHTGLAPMIKRHQCAVGRQGLYAIDWASYAWIGLELVGRMRDAYRASDILRFFRRLVMMYGKPDMVVFEQGVWKSRSISGWKVKDDGVLVEVEDDCVRPEMSGDEQAKITDGIHAMGVEVRFAYSPRGKIIEGAFNYLQTVVPTFLNPGEGINIGRHAGEFEWSAKQARRAADGVFHARDLGFVHIDRLADLAWQAMLWEGQHDKACRNGKPLEILGTYLQSFPLPPASERDLAVFLPEKRNGLIRNGKLSPEVGGDTIDFIHPEVFAALGDGVRVDYAFDPAEPTLGAAVYGKNGWLCQASYLAPGPVISARDRSEDPSVQLIKRYKLAHRTAARMIDFSTLRTVATASRRDGDGKVTVVTNAPQHNPPVKIAKPQRSIFAPRSVAQIQEQASGLSRRAALARALAEQTDF